MNRLRSNGFSLIEVVIALGILAMSLSVLLGSQAASINSAGRSRDLTNASLLARSKMIDIEVSLIEDGFVIGDLEEEGDFGDEGYEYVKYESRVSEVEFDLSGLASMCAGFTPEDVDPEAAAADCESMLGGVEGFGGMLSTFTDEIGRSIRLVELKLTWPVGKYQESFEVRSFVTKQDFSIESAAGGGMPDLSNIDPTKIQDIGKLNLGTGLKR
jgi:prepilin-type N-terminal cleavage/methylation domain-containing protein